MVVVVVAKQNKGECVAVGDKQAKELATSVRMPLLEGIEMQTQFAYRSAGY